jgi:hypothetical protein
MLVNQHQQQTLVKSSQMVMYDVTKLFSYDCSPVICFYHTMLDLLERSYHCVSINDMYSVSHFI